ncbi:MAG: beta-L-arabinofuranosidase domain-containing protein [Steroidobacteraceae bacterium]
MTHSRREALKVLGAGVAYVCAPAQAASAPAPASALRYFRLADVRLGEGPFLRAQKLDADYLLRLEPDRMLANFRGNAGLPPQAAVYGGWESVQPWVDIRCHGHTLGHYLTAAACMYESTGDHRFAERVDYIVGELAACQARTGGWLTAFPDGVAPLVDSLAGNRFAGVPWYTTHKVLAGLRDAHLHRGNLVALDVWVKFSAWIDRACAGVPEDRFQKMLDREHGGMNEVLADLYELTRENRYALLAQRFSHQALLRPLALGVDSLDGLHSNTQIPKVVGFSRIADTMTSGDGGYDAAARFFWRTVTTRRSFATGGHGDAEHFFPGSEFVKHLDSAKTMETCCTHNMMRLTRSLYARDPQVEYCDYFERALYNGILASQDPESGMNTYFQSTRPGYVRLYHTPFDSFWCCTGSGIENHARYGESIYAHTDDALYVNLFMASTLQWRERGLTITQAGNFPDSDTFVLRFTARRRQNLKVRIRHPAWCAEMRTVWNGGDVAVSRKPGSYFELPRSRIKSGDSVRVSLPMALRIEPLPDAPDHVALMHGPIVLAGRMGTAGLAPGAQIIVNERESGNMLRAEVAIPRWTRPLEELPGHTSRVNPDRLEFRTTGFAGGASVDFIPWFRLSHERYNLYWRQET